MPDLSRWRTSVTEIADSRIAYRGRLVGQLIEHESLEGVVWTLLFGGEPTEAQQDALRRAMIAALDHGLAAPSTTTARIVASTRGSLPLSVAAGLIAFAGPAHGGAAEGAAQLFEAVVAERDDSLMDRVSRILGDFTGSGRRVPGYGHPYHSRDPRVKALMSAPLPTSTHREIAVVVEDWMESHLGRRLLMNADAAVAAMLLDAGLVATDVAMVTALGRAFGLAAHAREELMNEQPFRAPALDSVEWIGNDMKERP